MKLKKTLAAFVVALSAMQMAAFAECASPCEPVCAPVCAPECCEEGESPLRLYVAHTEGKWIENEEGYTSFGVFGAFPLDSCGCAEFVPFVDLRAHVLNDGRFAGNFGGGLRYETNHRVFGINAYYDYLETHHEHGHYVKVVTDASGDTITKSSLKHFTGTNPFFDPHHKDGDGFHRVGIGAEMLSECWDVRANVYIPVGENEKSSSRTLIDYFDAGNSVAVFHGLCSKNHVNTFGFDLEVGMPFFRKTACSCFDLYGAIGTYYYSPRHDHHHGDHSVVNDTSSSDVKRHHSDDEIWGAMVRLESHIGRYFSVELRAGYDGEFKGSCQGVIALNVPFDFFGGCCAPTSCCDDIAYRAVKREEIIVLDSRCCWHQDWTSTTGSCGGSCN